MPFDDNEYTRLNTLMNSGGKGADYDEKTGTTTVNQAVPGRHHSWTAQWTAPATPAGCQVLHGHKSLGGQQVPATIFVKSVLGFDGGDQQRLVRWFYDDGELHQSVKIRGAPAGFKGYVHDNGRNRLYAVTSIDEATCVVEIPKIGSVNAGWHVF